MNELINDKDALIDKVEIAGVIIEDVEDIEALRDRGILSTKIGAKVLYETTTGKVFGSIDLNGTPKSAFLNFKAGCTGLGNYCKVTITVNDPLYHNLNCFTVAQLFERFEAIKKELKQCYGISVSFANARYDYLEINKTIALNDICSSYHRCIRLFSAIYPSKIKLLPYLVEYDGIDDTYDTYDLETSQRTSGAKGVTLIFYDKTKELQKYSIRLSANYLRYEIKLNCFDKIKYDFGTADVSKITDEMINNYFNEFVFLNLIKPYYDDIKMRQKIMLEHMKNTYTFGSKTWANEVMLDFADYEIQNKMPLLLDVEELLPLLDKIIVGNPSVKSKTKNKFKKLTENRVWGLGDNYRAKEILRKLNPFCMP